jgi:predicted nucleotide-binding protein (sugar kinase/HSP70/actin superfamily)
MRAAIHRSFGFDAVAAGPSTTESLARGRSDCSGKECLPYQILWGTFRTLIEDQPSEKRTILMQTSGEGMCRFCMYSVKDQMSVDHLGLEQKVVVRHSVPVGDDPMLFFQKAFAGMLAWDLLNQLVAYYRPLETSAGEVDCLYHRFCDEAEELLAHPSHRAGGDVPVTKALAELIKRAAERFAELARRAPVDLNRRTVFLSGDFYVKADSVANDSLIRRLNERGLHVVVEPVAAIMEYTAEERISDLFGVPSGRIQNTLVKRTMRRMTREFYLPVQKLHPWLPLPDIPGMIRESRKIIGRHPQGEAPVIVGSVLHSWRQGGLDGVVAISAWGCGPALVAESLLRHQRDIPMLFVYTDGTPIDERKLNAFAFRLRRTAPRSHATVAIGG